MLTAPLPEPLATALKPLFEALPLDEAMPRLVVPEPARASLSDSVAKVLENQTVAPAVAAGLWLFVDELDKSHKISQGLNDDTGSFWHGIMHRREGDFSNSHHWFNRAGDHPAMKLIDGYDGHTFIDRVEQAHKNGAEPSDLVALQRREWEALFGWCNR